jgi:hypothetical protein
MSETSQRFGVSWVLAEVTWIFDRFFTEVIPVTPANLPTFAQAKAIHIKSAALCRNNYLFY